MRAVVPYGDGFETIGPFSIYHVRNSGILGGHLQGNALPLALIGAVAVAGVVVYLARRREPPAWTAMALGLLVGGALGNLVDRLRLGYVTDFIRRGDGGAFNVADVAIFVGVVLLVVTSLLRPAPPPPGKPGPIAEQQRLQDETPR